MLFLLLVLLPLAAVVYLFRNQVAEKRVVVVVLGDIGRSPRMQYHAISLAKEGYQVDFIGYGGSIPHQQVLLNKKIHIFNLKEPHSAILKLPRLIVYVIKVFWRSFALFVTLMLMRKPSYLLLQNPPAIPTLAICWLTSLVRDVKFIIDWHNYGYTILGLSVGADHPLVKFAAWYEKLFGQCSFANICVTQAMREDLKNNWNIEAVTMYDRPPSVFKRTDVISQHKLFCKLAENYDVFRVDAEESTGATVMSESNVDDGSIFLTNNRPALLVSSTSWTEDEDFSVLIKALDKYEAVKQDGDEDLPDLLCVITGKGPLKKHYTSVIAKKYWKHILVCTPWLEAEDYPKLLGSADLGVCLHTSSSGLDLPMKVVDMFGCQLPVCAIHYQCLDELVKHGENGLVFKSDEELAQQLQDLLRDFPHDCKQLKRFRDNLKSFQETRWDDSWKNNVLPLLQKANNN